ncbi:MAG: hypothetical protein WCG75_02875 [Armatimonadota bacterium]
MMLLALSLPIALTFQTTDQIKSTFNSALIHSDGAKLYSTYSPTELNGASAKACTSFLQLVTKPRIPLIGTYGDLARTKFLSILDPKSPMSIKFLPTGGASINIVKSRAYAFEPDVVPFGKSQRVSTGFAVLAFWAAHEDKLTKTAHGRLNRALAAHNLVKSWVPQFEKMGIKGSFDPDSKKYMSWREIIKSSQEEIDKMKSGKP